jgi:short-subunit dehydrogenase
LTIVADVSERAQVTRAASQAIERFGRVDVWVNNVGRGITRAPSELTDQDVDDMVRLNVKTVLYGVQAILPHFKQRGSGHIINVSSMLGRVPFAVYRSAYTGSKHFVNALTANLRAELRESYPGIAVTLVSPGVVETDFGKNAMHGGPDSRSLPYAQSVDEVGSVIAWAVETRVADVYTRAGSKARVSEYFAGQGEDPPAEALGWG